MTVLTTFHRHIAKTALRIPKLMGASALIVFASQPSFAAFKVIESQPATNQECSFKIRDQYRIQYFPASSRGR